MWLTNGASSNLVAVLTRSDLGAATPCRNMTTFLVEKEPGFGATAPGLLVPGKIDKMGYKGVDTTELVFDGYRTTTQQVLGGVPGRGFHQMMDGVEVGRVNVAARACGWPCGPSSWRWPTPSSARPSAGPSPSTRPCSSGWPRWPPRSWPPTR
jgi:alkylation response protein AidB-like acyl-CoA dehydrogenase